jgi:hypothetical protein
MALFVFTFEAQLKLELVEAPVSPQAKVSGGIGKLESGGRINNLLLFREVWIVVSVYDEFRCNRLRRQGWGGGNDVCQSHCQ